MCVTLHLLTYLLGAIIFIVVKTTGALWWPSSLSAEVERHAGGQGSAIPALEKEAQQCAIEIHNLKKLTSDQEQIAQAVKSLDVLGYRIESLETMLDKVLATKIR